MKKYNYVVLPAI